MKNVIAIYGINGVGKTTVTRLLNEETPGSIAVYASRILREALYCVTREHLELIPAENKMQVMASALRGVFNSQRDKSAIFLDHHLLLAIRRQGSVVYELLWEQWYLAYLRCAVFLTADAEHILHRRIFDASIRGRKRDLDLMHIREDEALNLSALYTHVYPSVPTYVIRNDACSLKQTVSVIQSLTARIGSAV